jgi:hypothetical protein
VRSELNLVCLDLENEALYLHLVSSNFKIFKSSNFDFHLQGKLLYCRPPPTIEPKDFQMSFTTDAKTVKKRPLTNSIPGNVS